MEMLGVPRVDLPSQPWSAHDEEALSDLFAEPISQLRNELQEIDSAMHENRISAMEVGFNEQITGKVNDACNTDQISPTQNGFQNVMNTDDGQWALHELAPPEMECHATDVIARKVKDVRNIGWRRRLRISLPSFLFGILCSAISTPLFLTLRSEEGYGDLVLYSIAMFVTCLGFLSYLVSLLPSDRRAVPCTALLFGVLSLAVQVTILIRVINTYFVEIIETGCSASMWDNGTYEGTGEEMDTGACFATWVCFGGEFLIVHLGNWGAAIYLWIRLCTFKQRGSHAMLRSLWFNVRWVASNIAVNSIIRAFVALLFPQYISFIWEVAINIGWLLLALISHPRFAFRTRVQSWLSSFGEGTAVAAGVAELLGDESVETLIAKAKSSLYYVSADALTKEDMAENSPNPALSRFVQKGTLGMVDAFVSHSWRDDADAKWHSLQKWIADFKQKKGRAPTLWIDKYCIDQNNIDDSLMCLPVYLSGCKQLLVLCGETYLQRLWCLVEIFVFATMLGQESMTEVRYLNKDSSDDSAPSGSLRDALTRFDSRHAVCSNDYDTHRLRSVVEASDMGKDGMTELVNTIFQFGRPSARFSVRPSKKSHASSGL